MANSGIYEDASIADDNDNDSSLLDSDSERETETLPDQDREFPETGDTEAEEETLEFADSPTDGYFTNRNHPQHTFVQGSSVQAEADRKAREAAQSQAEVNARRPISASATSASPTDTPVYRNHNVSSAPMLDAGPAPPDYAAATAHRHIPSQLPQGDLALVTPPGRATHVDAPASPHESMHASSLSRNTSSTGAYDLYWPFGCRNPFRTSNRNGHESPKPFGWGGSHPSNETRRFTSRGSLLSRGEVHPAQSMSDLSHRVPDEETGLLSERKSRSRSTYFGCCSKIVVVLLVIAAIAIAGHELSEWSETGIPENEKSPLETALPTASPVPSVSPVPPSPPTPRIPDIPPSGTCPYSSFSSSVAFDFPSPASFSFSESLKEPESFSGGIHGKITVSTAKASQDASLRVWVTYATTAPWRVSTMNYVLTETGLDLHLPDLHKQLQASNGRPCLYLDVVIEVKEGTVLEDWNIATTNLDLLMDEALFMHSDPDRNLKITHESFISTTRGSVGGAWSSRDTKIETTFGSVTGAFALMDLLSVRTFSGSIDIAVEPKEADPECVAPAEYIAITKSGSIKTEIQPTLFDLDLPIREYRTRVETISGRISGTYIHGNTTSFSTKSGSIDVDVLPIDARLMENRSLTTSTKETRATTIRTDTISGTIVLYLRSPFSPKTLLALSGDEDRKRHELIDNLKSEHKSKSGSVSLTYPEEWTGEIEGESHSGSIIVKGMGVYNPWWGPLLTHFYARKGSGNSDLGVSTVSGSINVLIGKV